jgi:predicted nucleic acid-binding Zn ribbon protein
MKKCPFCAEEILEDAVKCRYCGEFLDKKKREKGCFWGCLISLGITILLIAISIIIISLVFKLIAYKIFQDSSYPPLDFPPFDSNGFREFFQDFGSILEQFLERFKNTLQFSEPRSYHI